jgi:hypothetical protein
VAATETTPELIARVGQRLRDFYSSLPDDEKPLFETFCRALPSADDEVQGHMHGDFSKATFDPGRHYAGVLMQQGRVQLDSDYNESSISRSAALAMPLLGDWPPR